MICGGTGHLDRKKVYLPNNADWAVPGSGSLFIERIVSSLNSLGAALGSP